MNLTKFVARYDSFAIPAFAAVWLTHVVLTLMRDPLGLRFDIVLWISASILRVGALISLVRLLARAHAFVAGDRARAIRVFMIWSAIATAFVLIMSATREWWAPLSSNRTAAFYYLGGARRAFEVRQPHRLQWVHDWKAGYVIVAELALAYALCGVQVWLGFHQGRRPRRSVPIGLAATFMLLVAYLALCPWFSSDYDFFHGELYAGAVLLDLVSPLANDPYTTFSTFCYLAAWAAVLITTAAARRTRART